MKHIQLLPEHPFGIGASANPWHGLFKVPRLLCVAACVLSLSNCAGTPAGDPARDPAKEVARYEKAANQGDSEAMLRLAAYYRFGTEVVGKDMDRALSLYRQAAAQGEVKAMRILGQMYHSGRGVPKDLAEAEKWYRMAAARNDFPSRVALKWMFRERNPEEWALAEKKEQAAAEERRIALFKRRAREAKSRFGVIHLSVTEAEETKQLRAQAPNTLDGLMRSTGDVVDATAAGSAAVGTGFGLGCCWINPVALGVGAVVGLIAGIDEQLKKRIPKEKKAEIKAAVATLNGSLADERVERETQAQVLALADSLEAKGLLVTESAAHRLDIEIQNIGVMKVQDNSRAGRLWLAAQATLSGSTVDGGIIQQRFCYGGASPRALVEWAKDDAKAFREDLQLAYEYLAGKILIDMIGLAKNPKTPSAWAHTEKACIAAPRDSVTKSKK